jgi:hypothetical protein
MTDNSNSLSSFKTGIAGMANNHRTQYITQFEAEDAREDDAFYPPSRWHNLIYKCYRDLYNGNKSQVEYDFNQLVSFQRESLDYRMNLDMSDGIILNMSNSYQREYRVLKKSIALADKFHTKNGYWV